MGCLGMATDWEKIDEKDGLDIYKHRSNIDRYERFNCPLCYEMVTDYSWFEDLKKKGPQGIKELKKSYEDLINSNTKDDAGEETVDIFNQLEEIQNKIDDYSNHYDENRFYKYKCEKENKNCYLIIYHYPKNEFFKINEYKFTLADKRYEYSQWKNNENLKKTLLEEREKNIIKKKMDKINQQILSEWNEITCAKENDEYLDATKKIKQKAEIERYRWPDYGKELDLNDLFNNYSGNLIYSGSLYELCQYIAQFAINEEEKRYFLLKHNYFPMSKKESGEYAEFRKLNLPKYLKQN
jgi:hypothetical protein